ncbi:hypothetical protein GC207_09525 [bacterium]|nr:hypothetical protein [bacterium]
MKTIIGFSLCALCATLTGCDRKNSPGQSNTAVPATNETVVGKIQDTAGRQAQKVDQSREAVTAAMADTLTNWDAKLDELSKRTATLSDSAKAESGKLIASLQDELNQAKSSLQEVKSAGEDKWQDVKAGFDDAIKKLKANYDDAAAKLK